MTSRRDLLQGCLLAGVSLALPRTARSADSVSWTATWRIEPQEDNVQYVFLTVSPDHDTTLDPGAVAPAETDVDRGASLHYRVAGDPTLHTAHEDGFLFSRSEVRIQPRPIAQGASYTYGPWRVQAAPDADLHLRTAIRQADGSTVAFEHRTGKPRFQAEWEVLPAGRSAVQVRVALTVDRDTEVHLINGVPPGFRVQAGGTLSKPPGPQSASRAGPRRHRFPMVAGETTKLGGWLVKPDDRALEVVLDLEHSGGQTHFAATLPVDKPGA